MNQVNAIIFDFTKALDKVPHKRQSKTTVIRNHSTNFSMNHSFQTESQQNTGFPKEELTMENVWEIFAVDVIRGV